MMSSNIYGLHLSRPKLYRKSEVAKIFGVTTRCIQKWVERGEFIRPDYAKVFSGRSGPPQAFWTAADIEKEKLKRGIK